MRKDGKLKVEEVAVILGVSVPTINNWYRFKKYNPKDEISQLLPKFYQDGERSVRLWDNGDIPQLIQFKNSIPKGRGGVMGSVTQKYYHNAKEKNNGKKNTRNK